MFSLRLHGPRCRFGLLMAVLALLGQVLGPAMPVQAAARAVDPSASPFGGVPICHAGTPDGPGGEVPPGHAPPGHTPHRPQCALCPACHALAAAAALPVPASPIAAPPPAPPARHALPPPARGPPGAAVRAATYPTGPPLRLA